MDNAVISLRAFEPAGSVLNIGVSELVRHILGVGSTGSGKTTALVNPIMQQVIAYGSGERRMGLLILDGKGDETVDKVMQFAREAGRENDVLVLGGDSECRYDFFEGLSRLDQVDEYTGRLLSGSRSMGVENAYWTEARVGLVNTALTILLASESKVTFEAWSEFGRAWWFGGDYALVNSRVDFVTKLLDLGKLDARTQRRLELAVLEVKNWQNLDNRTKEIQRSTLGNALRPLFSPSGTAYFLDSKPKVFHPRAVLEGKILVASCSATIQPLLASMLFTVLKRDFYDAVERRASIRPEQDRLCGLIVDELPLVVSGEDCDRLAVIRSKGGFLLGCAQSLTMLDHVIGQRRREALLANFCSTFFFNGRDDATDAYTMLAMGHVVERISSDLDMGGFAVSDRPREVRKVVCPPGALAQLGEHQCYAKLASGQVTAFPHWLSPLFVANQPKAVPPPVCDGLANAVKELKRLESFLPGPEKGDFPKTGAEFLLHMHRRGHELVLSPQVLLAAWQVCVPKISRNKLLARAAKLEIQGLETLPTCWLYALTSWLERNREIALNILNVECSSGVLMCTLHRWAEHWGDGPVRVQEIINLLVYPSLWRPLKREHVARLRLERPDLRDELACPTAENPIG